MPVWLLDAGDVERAQRAVKIGRVNAIAESSECGDAVLLLKEQREQQRLSLSVLAQKAGLSRQSFGYVEQEKRIPNLYTLLCITRALGVDLESILARARERASVEGK
jgi:DNA-binding XRE family transcriptional regulator